MSSSSSSNSELLAAVYRFLPSIASGPNDGSDKSVNDLIKSAYPNIQYDDGEKASIHEWIITSNHVASPNEDAAKTAGRLSSLNSHLSTRTTLLGSKPSIADVAMYSRLAPIVAKWTPEERTGEQGYHHITRHLDFVQNAPLFGLNISDSDKIVIDTDDVRSTIKPIDPKAEKERKKKEKEAATAGAANVNGVSNKEQIQEQKGASGGRKAKKEGKNAAEGGEGVKKEKQPKPQKQPAQTQDAPLSPSLIDLRVGHILKAENHPNADSLYVSTIAVGDAPGTDNTSEYEGQVVRTVCSGLNGLVPLAEMQNRKIVAVCNLKPVTMRGIKSAAMVLAASPRAEEGDDGHKGPVELVSPPEGAAAGERVFFEGFQGEPEKVLNPKKKVWENCQVGFTTTDSCEVAFNAGAVPQIEGKDGLGKLRTAAGICTVQSLKGATVR